MLLFFLVAMDILKQLNFLIEKGANIRAFNDGALRFSSGNGHIEVVKYLIEKGANIHAIDDHALRWSSSNGHIKVVKFLVENRADIHADDEYALRLSSENGHIDVVKFLLNSDLEYFAINKYAIEIVKKHNLSEFYEKFKINLNTVSLSKNDILNYIDSQDIESIKKCDEFDFSTDEYDCFFKALELDNNDFLQTIFDFIKDKKDLKNYFDDISFIFNDDMKNNYYKLIQKY